MKKDFYVLSGIECEHGEGPVWCNETNIFYNVDISGGEFYSYHYSTNAAKKYSVGQPLGVLALTTGSEIIMGLQTGIGLYNTQNKKLHFPAGWNVNEAHKNIRFNDGAVDPAGRFLAGTMTFEGDKPVGKLYQAEKNAPLKIMKEKMFIPNGMGWSNDGSKFYLTDTPRLVIYAYDYDTNTGNVLNEKPFIQFENGMYPDGMCIDTENNFWVAIWGRSVIKRFNPFGKLLQEFSMPFPHVTSCCFGGEKMNQLFITSSRRDLNEKQRKEYPLAGHVLVMETNATGKPQNKFSL